MKFFYGAADRIIDITKSINEKSRINEYIIIPFSDVAISSVHGDPCPGIVKEVRIVFEGQTIIITREQSCIINTLTNEIKINDPRYFWNNIGQYIELPESKLRELHRVMSFEFGSLHDEYPEQLMSIMFLDPNAKVLEIGGNIGRNSCIIGSILNDDKNLVTLECCEEFANQLKHNRDANNLKFSVEVSALSQVPLIQQGWVTKVSNVVEPGYSKVNTITFDEIEAKYNITFDTFVLDCEGAFYQILKDNPDCLKNIKTIIIENDFQTIEEKQFVDNILNSYGLVSVYQLPGGWGPCYHKFYEVLKKIDN